MRRPAALLALVLLVLGGTAPAAAAPTSAFTGTPLRPVDCPMPVPDAGRVECARFAVPESRHDPDGDHVELLVAVLHSEVDDPTAAPVLVTAGGPGSASGGLTGLAGSAYARDRDVVVLEQRGTGNSEPALTCPELGQAFITGLTTADPPARETTVQVAAARACADRLRADGVDLAAYTTAENAADVADLRVALGHDEWDLWGLSYSTRLMLTVLRDHPEGVRSLLLDSAVPTDVPEYDRLVAGLQAAWDRLVATCAADAACARAHPRLDTALAAAAARLDEQPLEVAATHPDTGGPVTLRLTGDDLVSAVFNALYDPQLIRYVPLLVDRLGDGDAGAARPVADAALVELTRTALGLYYSVQCAEMVPMSTDAAAEADAGALAGRAATRLLWLGADREVCRAWGVPARPEAAAPVVSDVPVLVMAGQYDPITLPETGRALAARLGDATFVEVPGQGHTPSLQGDCAPSIAVAFLDDPHRTPDTRCLAGLGPVDVVLDDDVHLTSGVYRLATDGVTPVSSGLAAAVTGLLAGLAGLGVALVRSRRRGSGGRRRAPAALAATAAAVGLAALAALALVIRDTLAVDELVLGFGLPAAAAWLLWLPVVAALLATGGLVLALPRGRVDRAPVLALPWVLGTGVAALGLVAALAALDLLP
ncbi:alpha/beta fold hydrolase [Modestobacter italicus]|uniref:alpha/beta fold hydrolase n=1 Tax=Modestobacter italicus (strain DSM 44449 / CECT 9708 / BC 501) TaxID=2732864 RepID=UPI001C95DE91|nr:alpha/beta fold hydrolase [Modestobacter italicus]